MDTGGDLSIAEVYSERTNTWKADHPIPYNFTFGNWSGVLVSETLHWIANHCSGSETQSVVLSFGIRDESFKEVPLPENVTSVKLGVLGGDLCVIDYCVSLFLVLMYG
ncbi:hypothetical protein MKX03_016800, partial [Papaver bracteatum]